jgi:hypothetical protein
VDPSVYLAYGGAGMGILPGGGRYSSRVETCKYPELLNFVLIILKSVFSITVSNVWTAAMNR